MSQIAINTSQNVNINFNSASIGDRILAFVIDLVIKAAYLLVMYFIFFRIFNLDPYLNTLDNWSVAAIMIFLTFPVHIYTLVTESLMEGQTVGKRLVRIKVVKIDGFQASFADYLMRWVFRLVDVYSNSGVVGLVSMIVSRNNQRLGDIVAGTAVISLKSNVNISHTILEHITTDYAALFPQVIALTDNDVRIIKENYERAMKTGDRQIISRLTAKIKETLKLEALPDGLTERKFIATIIKDYNFYTGQDI